MEEAHHKPGGVLSSENTGIPLDVPLRSEFSFDVSEPSSLLMSGCPRVEATLLLAVAKGVALAFEEEESGWGRGVQKEKLKRWMRGVSIPLPRACEARDLPSDLRTH